MTLITRETVAKKLAAHLHYEFPLDNLAARRRA